MDNSSITGLLVAFVFALAILVALDKYTAKEKAPEKDEPCQHTEWVQVTHRDGFWYCFDDHTVSWNGQWKPATMIEKRRAGL